MNLLISSYNSANSEITTQWTRPPIQMGEPIIAVFFRVWSRLDWVSEQGKPFNQFPFIIQSRHNRGYMDITLIKIIDENAVHPTKVHPGPISQSSIIPSANLMTIIWSAISSSSNKPHVATWISNNYPWSSAERRGEDHDTPSDTLTSDNCFSLLIPASLVPSKQ